MEKKSERRLMFGGRPPSASDTTCLIVGLTQFAAVWSYIISDPPVTVVAALPTLT
jgi:hypothetical protein